MHILLVEGEEDLAQPLVDMLRHEGFEPVWAADLRAAYAALERTDFGLVVLDVLLLEDVEGRLELARALRGESFTGGLLFLTTRDTVIDRTRDLDLEGEDYMLKPFSLREFMDRVHLPNSAMCNVDMSATRRQGVIAAFALSLGFGFGPAVAQEVPDKPVLGNTEPVALVNGDTCILVDAKVDTGADRSSVDEELAEALGLDLEDADTATFSSALGETERPIVDVTFYLAGDDTEVEVSVSDLTASPRRYCSAKTSWSIS